MNPNATPNYIIGPHYPKIYTGIDSFIILDAAIWTTVADNPCTNLPRIRALIETIYVIKHEKIDKILKSKKTFFLLLWIIKPANIAPTAFPKWELKLTNEL